MLVATILVATSFVVGAAITRGLDPAVLTLIRFLLASLLLAPYARRQGLRRISGGELLRYAGISASIVVFLCCMFTALRYTSALNTSAIFTLAPGISGLYGLFLLRERLGRARLIALACGLVGALWVIFRGEPARLLLLDFNRGDLLFFAGTFAMALYPPLVKRWHRREAMAVMTFWVMLTGAGWLLLLAGPELFRVEWRRVAPLVWAGIAYLAVFTTVVTFFLNNVATVRIGSPRVAAYSYLYPAFVLLLDWRLGHGLPPLSTLPGIGIVVLATIVVQSGVEPPVP